MQLDRLDGWMVRQIGNADMAKETIVQLKQSSPASRATRPTAAMPRRINGGVAATRRSVAAIAGQEMCSVLPHSPRIAPSIEVYDPDESVEKKWRAQLHDLRKPCIEAGHVDRTKVLHNMMKKKLHDDEEQSPLLLWGLPREHILEFIRQSVLPTSWINPSRCPDSEWEVVSNEEGEVARVRQIIANVLATASSKSPKKKSSPRAPSSPRCPHNSTEGASSPRRRAQSVITTPSSPRSTQITQRSEERIQRFIADLRADPTLWAAFQQEIEQIQQQYRQKNHIGDKIRENKERSKTPRSPEDHELRKKQAAERMERTHRHREQIIQLEDEKLAAKREAYLRKVNPDRQLAAELEQTPRYRRRKLWLHVVSFAAISHRWHQQLVQTKHIMAMAKIEGVAACIIQKIWRKWKWQHASKHTVIVYTWLRKCLWKQLLRVRCRRKARNAALLRQFMLDQCTQCHAKKNFNRVMIQWRGKVIRAQKAGMSFINCNRARLHALSIWWDNMDHERQRMERQQNIDERRLSARKDSISGSAPGSAGKHRSRAGSVAILGGMDEKLATMQMLITPVELQRLQQTTAHVVKIPKSIKWQLLTEHLIECRKEFRQQQQAYKEMIFCASYAREVKLEEARAIVQGSLTWDEATDNRSNIPTGSTGKPVHSPPCFVLFSNPNGAKIMEELVRRGVQLALDADPELRALVARQQEHRVPTSRRPSVSFSGASAGSPSLSPSRRYSILKKPTQPLLMPLLPSVLATNTDTTTDSPSHSKAF
ncbi:hypothetical protein GN958_ATG05819 [Phytophthora infestans]|uniref:Uncharacterized protein n=1 Tax=Phytophthora infestans TaxID=4787 RepID=A0A8S9V3H1_PHYIN|nr:hypothetical protein GN958_ATG05819 [Phytophthora infestans]